jgi:hypothetical protein
MQVSAVFVAASIFRARPLYWLASIVTIETDPRFDVEQRHSLHGAEP